MTQKAGAVVTPVVLTYNEEPNIGRCLDALRWARRVVVVDSGSTDATRAIVARHPHAVLLHRPFDDFKRQTDFAITHVDTDYVLPLDADMIVPPALVEEIEGPFLGGGYAGGLIPFEYWMLGRPLPGSLLAPQPRIFRRASGTVIQLGHGHTFAIDGAVHRFRARLIHDDRKSVDRWASTQIGYSKKEQARMAAEARGSLKDRMRRMGLMPLVTGTVAYVRCGGPFGGKGALCYAYERVVYECILAMRLFGEGKERDA